MLTSDSMGMEFIWWVGVVEDRHDPMYLGRCKVRCLGWHTDDKKLMPPGKLPWAFPLMPITSASQTGVGQTPLGPVEGSWVMGFFRDGKEAQEPVMMGTLHGVPEQDVREIYTAQIGFYDARMYDNKIASDMHPFSLDAAKKRIRSLLLGADTRQEDKVPREAEMLTYSGAGVGVIITEQEQLSLPFPEKKESEEERIKREEEETKVLEKENFIKAFMDDPNHGYHLAEMLESELAEVFEKIKENVLFLIELVEK